MDEIYIQIYTPSFDHVIICNYLSLFATKYHQLHIVTCKGMCKFKLQKLNSLFSLICPKWII